MPKITIDSDLHYTSNLICLFCTAPCYLLREEGAGHTTFLNVNQFWCVTEKPFDKETIE